MKGLIFTYLATYGGAVVSLFRPFNGLLIYICFAIIRPEALWYRSVPQGNYSRTVFAGLFVGWALAGFGSWRFGRARAIATSLCVYQLWVVVSAFDSPDAALARNIVEETGKIVLPVLVGLSLVDSMAKLKQVAWVIALSHGYLALEFNISYYEGFNRLVQAGFAGADEKSMALSMAVAAPVALFLALSVERWWLKGIAALAAVLMMHVPLFTFARGGMLGLIVSGVVAVWLIPKKLSHLGAVAVVIALGLGLTGPEVRTKFMTIFASEQERDGSAQSRLDLWGQAWETMLQNPVAGVGPRHWGRWAYDHYGWGSAKEVHNTWFQTGAELGVPGVTALAFFFLFTAFRLLPIARSRTGKYTPDETEYARMVVCALAGFLVASQFITAYGFEAPFYIALIGAGLLKLRSVSESAPLASPGTFQPAGPAIPVRPAGPPPPGRARPAASVNTPAVSRAAKR